MPPSDIRGAFGLTFAEQVDFFRKKINLPTEHWNDLLHEAHDRAFVVAGATKADLLADLNATVSQAIDKGAGLEAFRKDFHRIVTERGWHGWTGEGTKAGEAWRARVIWETNLLTSYAAGRHAQLSDPELLARRPYWRYVHSDGVLHPRPLHVSWNGLVLRHDHPFWQTHYPPNGGGCHCRITAVESPGTDSQTEPPTGWNILNEKTGQIPGIDKGWAYAPGSSVSDTLGRIVGEKAARLPEELAKGVLSDGLQTQAFSDWFAAPKGAWPLARIPAEDAQAIGAEKARIGNLSNETLVKQKREHPEIKATEYLEAQSVIDHHTNKAHDHASMIYVREEENRKRGGYVLVVKATRSGETLWITSYRRLPRNEAERDSEIRRLLKKGKP